MKRFEIGPGVTCDLDRLVDTRLLVQANSGGGKSWLLRRLLEQTHGHVQHLVIDPEGEFASLRERFDYVLAAKSGGDTAADPRSAALLAERLLELKVSAILDIYELKPHERIRFVKLFLEALVNAPKDLWHPVLVIVDEAHVYCPEAGQAESADAVKDLATRGRKRGFCAVLATQRLSKLHKDAAAECNNKLIGRTTLDVDVKRAANELGVTDREALLILRALDPGEFFAYGPALDGKATEHGVYRTRTGAIQTTHPKAGGRLAFSAPPPTSKVKALLPKLADLPAEQEERVKSVESLKREVAQLRRDLTVAQKAQPAAPAPPSPKVAELRQELARHRRALEEAMKILVKVKAVDFPVETAEDRKALEQAVAAAVRQVTGPIEKRVTALASKIEGIRKVAGDAEKAIAALLGEQIDLAVRVERQEPFAVAADRAPTRATKRSVGIVADGLTPAEQRILNAAAWWRGAQIDAPTRHQVAFVAGYTVNGHFNNLVGGLRTKGQLDYPPAGGIMLTEAGLSAAQRDDEVPTREALIAKVLGVLEPSPGKIFKAVAEAGRDLTRDELAELTGYTVNGHFNNMVGSLRSLGVIEYPQKGGVRLAEMFESLA